MFPALVHSEIVGDVTEGVIQAVKSGRSRKEKKMKTCVPTLRMQWTVEMEELPAKDKQTRGFITFIM